MAGADDLVRDLSQRSRRLEAALIALSQTYAGNIEATMKANRPWQDRSGNARNRLYGRPFFERSSPTVFEVGVTAGHGMDYGIYLELGTRFMTRGPGPPPGAYPIVNPTLADYAPRFVEDARRLIAA